MVRQKPRPRAFVTPRKATPSGLLATGVPRQTEGSVSCEGEHTFRYALIRLLSTLTKPNHRANRTCR